MSLTLDQVEHIADLARLNLTNIEKARYLEQLSAILVYVARLQVLETADIPPTSSVLPQRSVLREDEAASGLTREELFKNAPSIEQNQFRIPPVFD